MTDEADGAARTGERSRWSRLGIDAGGWIGITLGIVFCVWASTVVASPDSSPGGSDSGYSSRTDDMSGSGDSTGTSGEGSFNCAMVPVIDSQIREIDQRITALQGGSVEGIPTYDESSAMANSHEIMTLRNTKTRLQRARSSAAADC